MSADALLKRAQAALADHRLDEALENCLLAIEQDPKSGAAYYLLGVAQRASGHVDQARQAWQRAEQLGPGNPAPHLALGQLALDTNDLATATREYHAALRLGDPRGQSRFGLGLALVGEAKYQAALPLVEAAVTADPDDAERLFTLTAIRFQLKQTGAALRNLGRLENLSSQDAWALSRIGKLLLDHGLPRQAEADFERSAAALAQGKAPAPPDLRLSDLYLQIAQLRFNRSDYLGAIEYLNKGQSSGEGNDVEAARLDLLGAAYLALGNPGQAREKQSAAAQLAPCDPHYISHLAWSDLLGGDLAAASVAAGQARSRWPNDPDVAQIVAIVGRESLPERRRVAYAQDWHLKGQGMVCCPCDTPCPCRSNAPPTHGHCESSGGFQVAHGHYGAIPLDGMTFAMVSGAMDTASVPAVIYVDSAATAEQAIALEHIFQQFIPLHQFVSLDLRRTKISYVRAPEADGRFYQVEIPGVLEMKIERQLNSAGEPLLRTAALDFFSNTLEYARNLIYKVTDAKAGLKWDYSGRQANFRTFDLDARDYQQAAMLIQYEDGTGYFTGKQIELIQRQKLPMLRNYPRPKASAEVRPADAGTAPGQQGKRSAGRSEK